mgnify:CR=1 FL=1
MRGWDKARSKARIDNFIAKVPRLTAVQTFDVDAFERRRVTVLASRGATLDASIDPIFDLPTTAAIVVHGVHVYAQLIDFSQQMRDLKMETVAGHERLLTMLHLHYAACDAVAVEFEAQRVDYHGPRMHAVIVTPVGPENERERIRRALQFANALQRTIEEIGRSVGAGQYSSRVRIGLDSGMAVAINSGRGSERDPLFLGSPANHAAKLAEGDIPGIFVSGRIRSSLGMPALESVDAEKASVLHLATARALFSRAVEADDTLVANSVERVKSRTFPGGSLPTFSFHHHEPPLDSIKFDDLVPSNAIRMELLSIFGDVSGFTAYVDECIAGQRIPEMVRNFHVIRSELAASLREDFNGRKIRYIGDCIHGVIAKGDARSTDVRGSIESAVAAAAGLRSSFDLCRTVLGTPSNLGIAFGIEFGATPISRIGIRGDRSVRCCVGKSVSESEGLQSDCDGRETRIGPRALLQAPTSIRRIFDLSGLVTGLDYASYLAYTAAPVIVSSGSVSREARPYLR